MIYQTNLFEDLPERVELTQELIEDIADRIMMDVVEPLKDDKYTAPGYWDYEHIIQIIVHKMKEHQDKLDRMDDLSNRNE